MLANFIFFVIGGVMGIGAMCLVSHERFKDHIYLEYSEKAALRSILNQKKFINENYGKNSTYSHLFINVLKKLR